MYRHIVVPLDGSPIAEQVLPHVENLAKAFGSQVTLLRVTRPVDKVAGVPVATEERWEEEDAAEAIPYLEGLQQRLLSAGLNASWTRAKGSVSETIGKQAAELNADLIAMTTHGRSGISKLALGSVAEDVVRGAPCPVLLVRAR